MPSAVHEFEDGPVPKRRKVVTQDAPTQVAKTAVARRTSKIFAPFRTVGLVSPTAVPFTTVPLGKTTFQITTSVGRSLQTYDLRRGLNLVFITRPQTPGPITATAAWEDKVVAAWSEEVGGRKGLWIFQRGKKVAELQTPLDLEEDVVQIIHFGSWIVGCCYRNIEVWNSSTLEHYTTLAPPFASGEGGVLTGGICSVATYLNKIFAGRDNGSVEIWNVSTGKLVYTIQPPSSDSGAVTVIEPTPALSLLAIAYINGEVIIHDIQHDREVLKINAGLGDQSPITSISFRTDDLGAGDDGRESGVMATASFNSGSVTLWDLNHGGKKMGVLRDAHNAPSTTSSGGISRVEFLPSQAILVTSGLDNSLKTWIFDETPFSPVPRILHSRSGHAAPLTTLDFLPAESDGADAAGKWLLSSSMDRSFWGWSLRRDGQSAELSQGNIKKKTKALGVLSNNMRVPDQSSITEQLKAPPITCTACSLNRDGGIGAMPGTKTIWSNAKQLKGKSTATEQNITGWESVVTGHAGDKFARTWFWGRRRAGRWTLDSGDGGEVKSVAVSPCGTFGLVGSANGGIDMYNLQSGIHRQRFPAPLTPAQAKRLKLQAANGTSTSQDKINKGLGKHTKAVTGIQVDNLNRTVVSCGMDGMVKFWDFMTGKLIHELDWRSVTAITRMDYHRPSDLIALTCTDGRVRVLDIENRRVVRELTGCKGTINDVCFSADGRWINAASSDSVIRVWDLPTGHLIDAIRLHSPCVALAFSNTGEFLAIAQEDSVGIQVWTNRTLFTHVPTRRINNDDIAFIEGPTASGEGGQAILAAAFEDDEDLANADAQDGLQPTLEQLSRDMTTLSVVPKSRWQTLLHLDAIRARNKPREPPKAPEKAPFFLPSALQQSSKDKTLPVADSNDVDSTALTTTVQSRVMKMEGRNGESTFTSLLRQGSEAQSYDPLIEHLKTLAPAAADIEIRSLRPIAPCEELVHFVDALRERLEMKRDYELVQAWMAVFLKCHGEVLQEALTEDGALLQAVWRWRESQRGEADRVNKLAGYCLGVVGFLRSTT